MKYTYLITANENGQIASNVVEALSSYGGEIVRGVAKCNPEDTFDLEFGMQLAAARCDLKVADKRVKRATKKYSEAANACEIAAKRLNKMQEYLCDATDMYDEAAARLAYIYNQV